MVFTITSLLTLLLHKFILLAERGIKVMVSLKDRFSDYFELPDEIVLDAPLIMLIDQKKLYLENHKGVALYQSDLIKIRVNSGYFIIKGDRLAINEIEAESIFVSGKITGIKYEGRGQ